MGALLNSVQLLVLLELVQGFTLLFNHVTVGEREVADSLDRFHLDFIVRPLLLFILEDLVGLDESIGLVGLVSPLILTFIVHLLSLVLQETLLFLTIGDLAQKLAVTFLVDLVNDLAKKVIIVGAVEDNSL